MVQSPLGSEFLDESLKLVSFCPVCDSRSTQMEARPLGERGETRIVHVRCRKCQHAMLLMMLVNQSGASSIGLLTDLSFEDVLHLRSGKAINVDDVIDAHTLFDGSGWEMKLGRVSQEHLHRMRTRLGRREKKRQRN